MNREITKRIIDGTGHDSLTGLGLTERNLRHIRSSGVIPARWYASIKTLADARGIDCPFCAFGFEGLEKQSGDIVSKNQVNGNNTCGAAQ